MQAGKTSMQSGKIPVRSILEIRRGDIKWQAIVLLVDKSIEINTRGEHIVHKFLLQDAHGTFVDGVLWNKMIEEHSHKLIPFKTYNIRAARVQDIKPEYQHMSSGLPIEWAFTQQTVVDEITNPNEHLPYPAFDATDLSVVESLATSKDPINILTAVIQVEPPRQPPSGNGWLQELLLIDRSLVPTVLTLWGDFINNQGVELDEMRQTMPIIVGRKLVTSERSVGKLSTNISSCVTIEPGIHEVKEFRNWVMENITTIRTVQLNANGAPGLSPEPTPATPNVEESTEHKKSAEIQNLTVVARLWIHDVHQEIAYCVCTTCKNTLFAEMNETKPCRKCKEHKKAAPRYKIAVCFDRKTENIQATMSGSAAEKLLKHSPENIHAMSTEEVKNLLRDINDKFKHKKVSAELRPYGSLYVTQTVRYTGESWDEVCVEQNSISTPAATTVIKPSFNEPTKATSNVEQSHAVTKTETNSSVTGITKESPAHNATPGKPLGKYNHQTMRSEDSTNDTPITKALGKHDASSSTGNLSAISTNTPEKHENKKLKTTSAETNTAIDAKTTEPSNKAIDRKLLAQVKIEAGTKKE